MKTFGITQSVCGTGMKTFGITQSVCGTCRRLVPAKIVSDGTDVYFQKFCPEHGQQRHRVRSNPDDYLNAQRHVKPAWMPREHAGRTDVACPSGCGFCQRHEQHLCMPIVEITSRCDLRCPVCLVDAGAPRDMTPEKFRRLLDALVRAEGQVDVLNLSGGEPLLHPELLPLVDEALARSEIVRVSISTNGLALLEQPELLGRLRQRNVVVSLQFDGFDDRAYQVLRGRRLLQQKLRILELLADSGISTSLTVTAAGGVNDDQFPRLLEYFFAQPHVVSMMIQPVAFAGRAEGLSLPAGRLTIPDVVELLGGAGVPPVRAEDFQALPCSHPLCFSLAFYIILDGGGAVSLAKLVDAPRWLDMLANRTIFGLDESEHQRIKDMIYELWSGPAGVAPDSEAVIRTLRGVLKEMAARQFDPRQAFAISERRVKSIFIHAFQDAETFDLARVRRCCNAYPQPDGTLVPACVQNVLRRTAPAARASGR